MDISYGAPVNVSYFTIKCIPADNTRQKLLDYKINIEPEHRKSEDRDSFGTRQVYGAVEVPHDRFSYEITGTMEMTGADYEEETEPEKVYLFRHSYGFNKAGDSIKEYFQKIAQEMNPEMTGTAYNKAEFLMHRLYRDFAYEPGSTDLMTGAEEAWKLGRGVCQDYAHIFTALAHLAGIPCRYVAGMIEGEGASHAWAEIYDAERGRWYGFDPTNDIAVSDRHIKLGHGRDASDCHINRGLIKSSVWSSAAQEQHISVSVREISG